MKEGSSVAFIGKHGLSLLLLWMGIMVVTAAPAAKRDFTGHYELAGVPNDQSFSLDITQTGSKVEFSFSAAMADGSGAAPDGDGKGEVDGGGTLKFKFTDSFGNAGTGTLVAAKNGYHLKMDATTVVEPRALRFYGDVILKKTASKPSP